ncbi:MAG: cytochrome b N-terminal domain-containing protein [Actinomycetes bacterium]
MTRSDLDRPVRVLQPSESGGTAEGQKADEVPTTWTGKFRAVWMRTLPPDKMLPERQPAYVSSWIYVFGMLTIVSLIVVVASGLVLTMGGVAWWHTSSIGHYVNSLHFWSVQLFFVFMVIHLWGKFWMSAWRGRRATTWITGAIAMIASIVTGFTGYLIQSNFNSQWIAFESKDVLNSVGLGALINVTDFGQMVLLHVCLLPLAVGVVVVIHVLLVRFRGVVPPLEAIDPMLEVAAKEAKS